MLTKDFRGHCLSLQGARTLLKASGIVLKHAALIFRGVGMLGSARWPPPWPSEDIFCNWYFTEGRNGGSKGGAGGDPIMERFTLELGPSHSHLPSRACFLTCETRGLAQSLHKPYSNTLFPSGKTRARRQEKSQDSTVVAGGCYFPTTFQSSGRRGIRCVCVCVCVPSHFTELHPNTSNPPTHTPPPTHKRAAVSETVPRRRRAGVVAPLRTWL